MGIVGAPSWVDVAVDDMDAEAAFYSKVLGWQVDPPHPEAGGWRQATANGDPVAGMSPRQPMIQMPVWMTFFGTTDADAGAARITELGGTTFGPPMDVVIDGTVMTRLVGAQDPTGAMFGLSQPVHHQGFQGTGPGHPNWFELLTRDLPAAIEFYTGLLGATATEQGGGPMPYTHLDIDGKGFGGIMAMPPQVPSEVPSYWAPYFEVEDANHAVDVARREGATVLMGPETMRPGRVAMLMDPEGAMFNVLQPANASEF